MAWKATLLLLCLVLGAFAQTRVQRTILDDYTVASSSLVIVISDSVVLPVSTSNTVKAPSILGGERDLILTANTGVSGLVFNTGVSSGVWSVSAPSGASGIATTQYDGVDNSAALSVKGLGGVDFTKSSADSFKLTIETDISTTITISVTDMVGGASTLNLNIAGDPGVAIDYYAVFTDFNGNANFANAGSVQIEIQALDSVDIAVDIFATAGISSAPIPGSGSAPVPGSGSGGKVSATPTPAGNSWYRFDDDDEGAYPCGEEDAPNTVFLADNNIIYYYFYGLQRPYIYVSNPNNNDATLLIPSIFACIFALFAL